MKQGNKKIFRDKRLLTQMLNLRLNGVALSSLAWLFGCDRDSITKQCQRYGVVPLDGEIYMLERIVVQTLPKEPTNYRIINGERINLGKSYKEYLAASGIQYPPRRKYYFY